jgi:hypothetical protein
MPSTLLMNITSVSTGIGTNASIVIVYSQFIFMYSKKIQLIIVTACHSCIVTRKVHHHTTLSQGLGFLIVVM